VPSAHTGPRPLAQSRKRLKPLSGNVCLRPSLEEAARFLRSRVSNPSRGTCAFGRRARSVALCPRGLKPLSGNVCLRPCMGRHHHRLPHHVSNPSRGTCAFGRKAYGKESARRRRVSNPSRGTCAFGLNSRQWSAQRLGQSQTPLGERVPSAAMAQKHVWNSELVSNPSRGTCAFGHKRFIIEVCTAWSQTPLGERVPSAEAGA